MKKIGVGLLAGLLTGSSFSMVPVARGQSVPSKAAPAAPSEARARAVSASTIRQTVDRVGKGFDLTYVVANAIERDLPAWRLSAGKNDSNGLLALGLCNYYGIGGPQNRDRGLELIQRAIDAENVDAMAILGLLLLKGDLDHAPQKDESAKWLNRAAEISRHPIATYQLALSKAKELWTSGKMEQGNAILADAATDGDLNAQVELALSQLGGWMQPAKTREPMAMLEKAASAGHIGAMINLAETYADGRYTRFDASRASRWLEAAVSTGDSTALMTAARFAERGTIGGQKNTEGAKAYWRRIEQSSEPLAMFATFHRNRQRYIPQDEGFDEQVVERVFDVARRGQPESYVWVVRFLRDGTPKHPADKEKSRAVLQWGVDLFDPNCTYDMALAYRFGAYEAPDEAKAWQYVQAAAALRVPQAMSGIAGRYEQGRGIPRDPTLAQKCYLAAAGAGDVNSMNKVAETYLYGRGVDVAPPEAERWARIAVANGDADGYLTLFELFRLGLVPGKTVKDGIPQLQQGVERGGEECAKTMARMLIEGGTVVQDVKNGLAVLESQLRTDKRGDIRVALAQYLTGASGVSTDYARALTLLREAASAGNSDAMFMLGSALAHGKYSLQANWGQALELYQKAITQGNVEAIEELGTNFIQGKGVDRDPQRAIKLWTDLSNSGSPEAMRNLARLRLGEWDKSLENEAEALNRAEQLVEKNDPQICGIVAHYYSENGDFAKARTWIDRGLALGDAGCYNELGDLYRYGRGVAQSNDEAAKNYRLAVNAGNRAAAKNLAWCYQTGSGVEVNVDEARRLEALAAGSGELPPQSAPAKKEPTTKP